MDFLLFLVVNATLFVRPAEIVPDLAALPIYNALIVLNLVVASLKVLPRFSARSLRAEPISACVLGLLASIVLSHVARLDFQRARDGAFEFSKVVLYYMLMVAVLDTPARLRRFLAALVVFVTALAGIALLHYHGAIDVPSLDAVADMEVDPGTGEEYVVMRLCSTGIYNDPNDLSLVLLVGTASCLFLAGPRPGGLPRPFWLLPVGVFLYALTLTHSRGGFLALLAGMMVLFYARFGAGKAALLGTVTLPAMFVLFAGRQTSISAGEDTGQDRIQLWVEGFAMLRESPLWGIGQNLYSDRVGLVAHNSFIHSYAELGALGGSLFLGAYAYAARTLQALGRHARAIEDPDLRRLRPYLLAMVVAYAFGMLTVSRNYVVPTYTILGLVTAYLRVVAARSPAMAAPGGPIAPVSGPMIGRLALASAGFLVVANVFIKVFVRHG